MSGSVEDGAQAGVATWPVQSWFLRSPLLSTVTVMIAVAALVTELSVMLIADADGIGYLGLGLSATGLLVIFRARWVGLALATAGGVVNALFAVEYIGIWTITVFVMFLFAKQGRHVVPAMAVSAAALYLALVARSGGDLDDPVALIAATLCVAAAAAGSAVRLQNESWEAARQHAADLSAAQAGELRQAVTDERLRIARDLHDVVGHELAVVNVNVGVAEVSLPVEAHAAGVALQAARAGLQRILQETQQILDLLRLDSGGPERSELALLAHIPSLVERVSATGAQIDAHFDPALPELEADVSAAAYRIVQEALTNAGKYGTGPVHLSVTAVGAQLVIDVENRPAAGESASPRSRAGYGIIGMRERTQSAGGTIRIFEADDSFRIHVELPTKASTQ